LLDYFIMKGTMNIYPKNIKETKNHPSAKPIILVLSSTIELKVEERLFYFSKTDFDQILIDYSYSSFSLILNLLLKMIILFISSIAYFCLFLSNKNL
jgi:hypothetical protein